MTPGYRPRQLPHHLDRVAKALRVVLPRGLSALLVTVAVIVVAACAPVRQLDTESGREYEDIHERLSDVIARAGFSHRIVSDRSDSAHLDSIHLRIPLDGMKRRHEGVERVLIDIARVCALPEFASLPIRIVVATIDEEDGRYLRAVMDKEAGIGSNVTVQVTVGSGEGIVIAVRHSPRIPRQR